jgi:alpha-methylacyl-CoA racemase
MGPLSGTTVVELGGVGPAPFCGMVLSDLGADVVRIRRPAAASATGAVGGYDALTEGILSRGRRSVTVDLKHPDGLATVLALVERSDALIEGFRPGVAERLGVGPDVCLGRQPALVYGRVTGWGQDGPLAREAGHDLDYLAVAGVVASIGVRGLPPVPPLNLIADFGGGGMLLATGVLAALLHARASGEGQVVDAAMVDGAAYLMTMTYELLGRGVWLEERESNANDGGAPFYAVYETADRGCVAVAAMEPQFYRTLVERMGLAAEDLPDQWDRAQWPIVKKRFAEVFGHRTRDEWCELFAGADACVAPVLAMSEAPHHPHSVARRSFVDMAGAMVPVPAPRFSRTPSDGPRPGVDNGDDTEAVLTEAGFSAARIAALRTAGAIG